ncbi:hypothetical protein NtRootA9_10910 [Arthrobacter sp. NtRootA9]|nr:hypothetical protein NtRootA9_10910 [Arthrobacter sp. NtRootA9]
MLHKAFSAGGNSQGKQQRTIRCTVIIVKDALFDMEPNEKPTEPGGPIEQAIQDHQVKAIRKEFAAAGIDGQDRRREIVQSCVMRPITALRELSAAEAHRVLQRIRAVAAAKPRPEGASAWDLREEATWIDKL